MDQAAAEPLTLPFLVDGDLVDAAAAAGVADLPDEAGDVVVADEYARNRATGAFILIDEADHATVGAGMITGLP
ncbi:hypothetical protein AB0I81_62065 [Nonomuraea sp. NPDC050404]|uniref:elongation factor 1-alpha C-terminal domain-related protein n=1 Tax=Nonomuraea sp. NPDC050404 TaxID=3155783 RepID=UPI0033FC5B9E